MPHTPSSPIHELRISRLRENSSIPSALALCLTLRALLPSRRLTLALPLAPPVLRRPLIPVVHQKRKRRSKTGDDQHLEQAVVDILKEVAFCARHLALVPVFHLLLLCGFQIFAVLGGVSFEEGGEPLGEGGIGFLLGCAVGSAGYSQDSGSVEDWRKGNVTRLILNALDFTMRDSVPPAPHSELA